MKKKTVFLSFLMIFFWILLIFYFSSQPSKTSIGQSNMVIRIIEKLDSLVDVTGTELFIKAESFFKEKILGGQYNTTSAIVRKSAHFGIYFVLGVFSTVFGYFYSKKRLIGFLLGVCIPVAVAVLDEYNQSFVGRTSSLEDVILDGMGAALGSAITLIVVIIFGAIFKVTKKRRKDYGKKNTKK